MIVGGREMIKALFCNKERVLPNFHGVMETLHYSKGRIRVRIPLLIEDDEAIKALEEILPQIEPIKKFRITKSIGTLLIEYSEAEVGIDILVGSIIRILSLEGEIEGRKNGAIGRVLEEGVRAIDNSVYNTTKGMVSGKNLISLTLLVAGVYQARKKRILPNGYNMVWWAYNSILGGKG